MKSWLAYCGAFALALAAAAMVYAASFAALMTGASGGMAAFVIFVPMTVALIVFGVSYGVFSGHAFSAEGWLIAGGFVYLTAFSTFILIAQDVLEEPLATLLLIAILFVGGRLLLKRASLV